MTMTPDCSKWKGYDLRENDQITHGYNGTYGTHMFTHRVQDLIAKHDQKTVSFHNYTFAISFIFINKVLILVMNNNSNPCIHPSCQQCQILGPGPKIQERA